MSNQFDYIMSKFIYKQSLFNIKLINACMETTSKYVCTKNVGLATCSQRQTRLGEPVRKIIVKS